MEDNHYVIKDLRPRNPLIENIPMISNHLFPLSIIPYMKGNPNTLATFKAASKEAYKHYNKEEKDSAEIQEAFQS